jgi:hypothetical protein
VSQSLEPKFPWKNGKLIGASHFQQLERWVESLVGWGHGVRGDFGLARGPHQKDVNAAGSVSVPPGGARWSEKAGGRVLLVTVVVEKLQAITPAGRLIDVPGTLTVPLEVDAAQARGSFLDLCLTPSAGANPEIKAARPEDGDAVRVARLRLGDEIEIDTDTYIPPCVTLGGCEASEAALKALGARLDEVADAAGQRLRDLLARRPGTEIELARSIASAVRAVRALAADTGWPPGRFFRLAHGWLRSCQDDLHLFAPESAVPFEDALGQLQRGDPRKDLRGCLNRAEACLDRLLDVVTGLGLHGDTVEPEPEPEDRTLRVKRAVAILPRDDQDVFCKFVVTLGQSLGGELNRAGAKGFEVRLAPGKNDGPEGPGVKVPQKTVVLVDPTVKESTAIPNVPEKRRPLKGPKARQPWCSFDYVPERSERELERVVFYLSRDLAVSQNWVGDVTAAVTVVGSDPRGR